HHAAPTAPAARPLHDALPIYQRRDAYRAPLKRSQSPNVNLGGSKLSPSLVGKLLDISATGCKLQFPGNLTDILQPGAIYERLTKIGRAHVCSSHVKISYAVVC